MPSNQPLLLVFSQKRGNAGFEVHGSVLTVWSVPTVLGFWNLSSVDSNGGESSADSGTADTQVGGSHYVDPDQSDC